MKSLVPFASPEMRWFVAIISFVLVLVILWDVFETIILPRRIMRRFRLARLFYIVTWTPWRFIARKVVGENYRESFLSFFGPLSLLFLVAVWAVGMVFGFAGLHWANGSHINADDLRLGHAPGFGTDLYMSGSTIFTLGLGDVTPGDPVARVITVVEAALGFGFLAVVVSYLPVLYQAFSRREANISLLDARAGSPPTAAEFIRRHVQGKSVDSLTRYLADWERWAAELMESHLSYPVLVYFRSLHNNQSWLSALTTILDVSALMIAYSEGELLWQAKLTFTMSRHAAVDLAQVLRVNPLPPHRGRLDPETLRELTQLLDSAGLSAPCCDGERLSELREMYEPYVEPLSSRLLMPVMGWSAPEDVTKNWRSSAWAKISRERPGEGTPMGRKNAAGK
jgi:Ion channel